MNEIPNPYQSPSVTDDHETWFAKLRRLFTVPKTAIASTPAFPDGGIVITGGIAFCLDTSDPSRIYAASPSTVHTDERMNLVVSEAIRAFPLFLRDNPTFEPLVNGRKLVVRLTATYADVTTAFVREHCLDWDYISGVIDAPHDGG